MPDASPEKPGVPPASTPHAIRMHRRDNVAIVANDGGLAAGTVLPAAWCCSIASRRGTRSRWWTWPPGAPVVRYGIPIGHALEAIPAGCWVNERRMGMPDAPGLDDLPIATVKPEPMAPLEGYTFEGFRNPDGSVGTRNILAITTTVQCVAGVVDFAVRRIKAELLPRYPNVDDVVGLDHTYGCGVAIEAPGAEIPIRTLRNISLNPNFGGEVMVVSLGCEKLQPERLMPPGVRSAGASTSTSCLQEDRHVGFRSMVESIVATATRAPRAAGRAASRDGAGERAGRRRAVRRQRRLLRGHREPGGRLLRRPLVRAGASVIFSEVTEVRDGIDQLTARAATPEVAGP